MGKRAQATTSDIQNYDNTPAKKGRSARKRIKSGNAANTSNVGPAKASRLNSEIDTEDDDEDSSSNDAPVRNCSSKQANNSSIFLNSSLKLHGALEQASIITNESPRPVYSLRPSIVNGTILYDLKQKPWRLGNPIGKGNFGEIFLASDNITVPVTNENAKFVVKIEPHSNGPLFVEIHCLLNTAKKQQNSAAAAAQENDIKLENGISTKVPSGIPDYIASGSHYFGDSRYRFLVLKRFDQDLHSLIKNSCVSQKSLLTLAIQIVNVLENLHDKGYCHNDVKSQNLMISKCKYFKKMDADVDVKPAMIKPKFEENYDERQPTTDSGNSSEQEANDDDIDYEDDFIVKRKPHYNQDIEDDEDFNDGTTSNSNSNSNSIDIYKTPVFKNTKRQRNANRSLVQYSGSNPVRSCRRNKRPNPIYEEMVNSHYLRPTKRISYTEFFADDGASVKGGDIDGGGDSRDTNIICIEDDESIGFVPNLMRRRTGGASTSSPNKKSNTTSQRAVLNKSSKISPCKRLTRRQEKLLLEQQKQQQQQQQHQQKLTPLSHFGSALTTSASASSIVSVPVLVEDEHIFLIDFGLASKYIDNGVHRPFVMDQRRAHDGTLEFTSRDAHMGAHSRRSDLECLGYNLIFWSQGFLPWKEAAAQQQQEKVHRAKEYLMTDVRQLLKQIYGKDIPKYLGEFLHLVGKLAYHERPQYARYRRLFEHEYEQLGYSISTMSLDSKEISSTCVRHKKDYGIEKHDFFELNNKLVNNNVLSIMKGGGYGTPFQERGSLGDRVSPKNLRSKSDKKATRKKKFSWTEVLSQDPDQIARERAEKEFDREINYEEDRPVKRYDGKPTYAILELLNKYGERNNHLDLVADTTIHIKDEVSDKEDDEEVEQEEEVDTDSDFDASAEEDEEDEEEEDDDDDDDEEEDIEDFGMKQENEEEEDHENSSAVHAESGDDDDDEEEGEEEHDDADDDDDIATSESSFGSTRDRKKYGKTINGRQRRSYPIKEKSKRTENNRKKNKENRLLLRKKEEEEEEEKEEEEEPSKNVVESVKRKRGRPKGSISKNKFQKSSKETLRRRNNIRECAGKQKLSASAAGEVEMLAQYQQQQQNGNGNGHGGAVGGKPIYKRPKRSRCLTTATTTTTKKTESSERIVNGNGVGGGGGGNNGRLLDVEDDSNSNFSPDVRILFNVWKKMSNENIYVKSAAAVAATKVATPATGGMVTRHYKK